jgi:hypothetical protein
MPASRSLDQDSVKPSKAWFGKLQWPDLDLECSWLAGVPAVKDYQASLEKLRAEAAECRLICDLATDPAKREMFDRLALHLTSLADQVELAMIEAAKPKRA